MIKKRSQITQQRKKANIKKEIYNIIELQY